MKKAIRFLTFLLAVVLIIPANAHSDRPSGKKKKTNTIQFRGGDCAAATKSIDQQINNVRARLLNGGDVWWDGNSNGRYIVPKVPLGQPEVSSIFAGAVWIGGFDPGGNLKLAAKTYGSGNGQTDFYPGPLNQFEGATDKQTCANWDRFFKVTADEIKEHLRLYNQSLSGQITYTDDMIPKGLRGWPSQGNPYFLDENGFELPNTGQGLAGFHDEDVDGVYDPLSGDHPKIEIRNCSADKPEVADEMIFWIYNDAGGLHTETGAAAMQMEVQVQAFAYSTNDFINDMTFQRYKLINRATEDITQCYFAMWVDPDLGCHTDDLIGCDTSRSLMYVYNQDAVDGQTGTTCPNGVNTYGTTVPILGVDYFRGPQGNVPCIDSITGQVKIDDFTGDTITQKVELGMSSFTYYNNPTFGGQAATTDPQTANEFYNYLTGRWRDGSPFQYGGCGYNTGGREIDYAFTSPPDCLDPSCWNMCNDCNLEGDRRTIQATGPLTLMPGDINELIIGVVWLRDQDYPCPSIKELQKADDVAQALFDNCFMITDGPDAPDVDWLEMDREVVGILSNDPDVSNNAFEQYAGLDLNAPQTLPDEQIEYRFEGYKVFQLADPTVSKTELTDPSKAALVFQADVDNEIGKIYNWTAVENPNPGQLDIWVPEEKVQVPAPNGGIQHTFKLTEDVFSESTDRRLINHKKYYYMAIAYAYNNWEVFDPTTAIGQFRPYLEGRGNTKLYTVIPRPMTYDVLAADFGESLEITRTDGAGAGSRFLDLKVGMHEAILSDDFSGELTYQGGEGPFEVKIFNPLDVQDGNFELTLVDQNTGDDQLDTASLVTWKLTNLDNPAEVYTSDNTIAQLNEQILPEFGFSITMKGGLEAGNNRDGLGDSKNGALGYEESYADEQGVQWLGGIEDDFVPANVPGANGIFDYIKTNSGEDDNNLDPTQAFAQYGFFQPYYLLGTRTQTTPVVSPVWSQLADLQRRNMEFKNLNNVDLVFTSDKSKWSRCVVLETTSNSVTLSGLEAEDRVKHMDMRSAPSVSKEDFDGDGAPDPDGDGTGMGWFPGYAIDVETGERLNVFFGEASAYRCDEPFFSGALNACNSGVFDNNAPTGADMMWNPTSQVGILNVPAGTQGSWQAMAGGMHFIYVTDEPYDGCGRIRDVLENSVAVPQKIQAFRNTTWAGFPLLNPATALNSYADGLIPNDLKVKLRVDNPFSVKEGVGNNNAYPTYRFSVSGKMAKAISTDEEINNALADINIVPNPYYGFSPYENSQFSTVVRITNLPAKCTVSIYSLDGKFIRKYLRDESTTLEAFRGERESQVIPHLEWNLRNSKGIPVASGVYLIHVDAPGYGERVLKWFGVGRQYDPSGL